MWSIIQLLHWCIHRFILFLHSLLPKPVPHIESRHIYTTQEIRQSARQDKQKVPVCPSSFQKWTTNPAANKGIDGIFYKPALFVPNVIESPEVNSEKFVAKWRRRKLFCYIEDTPGGTGYSLLLEYNPSRLGFQYASETGLPYSILNQAAMMYVKRFQCLDLFMDTVVCPSFRSPLVDLYDQFYFDRDAQQKKEDNQQLSHLLGREALWNRARRQKKETTTTPAVFEPALLRLNTFFRVRNIQEEWAKMLTSGREAKVSLAAQPTPSYA